MNINRLLAAGVFCAALAGAYAQNFEPLDRSYYPDKNDLVDTLLIEKEIIGTLPEVGEVYYYKYLYGPTFSDFNDSLEPKTEVINGKKWTYSNYSSPAVAYVITKLPGGQGWYYGFYTPGYEKFDDAFEGKPKTHPRSKNLKIYGTVVRPDGTRETLLERMPAEWKKLSVAKPAGTYYIHDFSNDFKTLEITFAPGGTGKIVYHLPRTVHQAPQEFGGSRTERYANGSVKKRHRFLKGGYHFNLDSKITSNMKWTYANGEITITPTGKPATSIAASLNEELTWRKTTVTDADRRFENSRYRSDMPTNEYVVEAKKNKQELLDEVVAKVKELNYTVPYVTKNEILVEMPSSNFPGKYFFRMTTDKNEGIFEYCMDNLDGIHAYYDRRRAYGADRQYKNFVNNGKIGIRMAGAPLSEALSYTVTGIDPGRRTGTISFLCPGKLYTAQLKFDDGWHVDKALLNSTLTEDTSLADRDAAIAANHDRIMQYKKDKRRGKIVKNYEKLTKEPIGTQFISEDQYNRLVAAQTERLKLQQQTLKELE